MSERSRRRWSFTNLLVVRHQIRIAIIAFGKSLEQSIDFVVVAAFFIAKFTVMCFYEFFNLLFIHLHESLTFWINSWFIFFVSNSTKNKVRKPFFFVLIQQIFQLTDLVCLHKSLSSESTTLWCLQSDQNQQKNFAFPSCITCRWTAPGGFRDEVAFDSSVLDSI